MTAQEAKQLAESKKYTYDSILDWIETMAKNGENFLTVETRKILDPTICKSNLEELGYAVTVGEKYFEVTW